MLIEYTDGKSGIIEYLKDGRKAGREFTREELDTRVAILGDIDTTEMILNNTDKGYKHITLSFKEENVNEEECKKLIDEYMAFLMRGYKPEEYNAYAEIHYPKQKSYTAANGELVIRKPHIHLVILKTNLLSNKLLRPLGYVKQNLDFTDAFQEKFNIENGYASPKDNRSNKISNNTKQRYNFEVFDKNISLKQDVMQLVLENNITDFKVFEKELEHFGKVRIANRSKLNEYLHVKEPHNSRATRLKEFVFSREFIETYSQEQKLEFLIEREEERYIERKPVEDQSKLKQYNKELKYWYDLRAKEVKYINQSTKYYKDAYINYSKEQRIDYINKFEQAFYKDNSIEFDDLNIQENFTIDIEKVENSQSVVSQKLKDIENEKYYKFKQIVIDMSKIYQIVKSTKGVLESKYQLVDGKIVAGSKVYDEPKNFLKSEMHFKKEDVEILEMRILELENKIYKGIDMIDLNEINRVFAAEQLRNRETENEKTTDAFMNIAAIKFDGVKKESLENWKKAQVKNNKDVDPEIYDKFIKSSLDNAEKLKNAGLMKEVSPGNYTFVNDEAKTKVFENYQSTSEILKQHVKVLQEPAQEVIPQKQNANNAAPQNTQEAFKLVPVNVNIQVNAQNRNKVDYFQIGKEDVAGRFTGVIHDKASEHDTARCYIANDKVVTQEEFRDTQKELYEAISEKQKELFNTKISSHYNDKLRMDITVSDVSLTKTGLVYENSQFNMTEIKPVQMGITPFEKKADKNFFTIAKEFITLKEFRDDFKVGLHDFKQKMISLVTSKPELAASNVLLAAQLKQAKIELASIKSYHAAQDVLSQNKNQVQEQEQEQSKTLEAEVKPEHSTKKVVDMARNIYDTYEHVQDAQEMAKDIQKLSSTLSKNNKEELNEVVELLDNAKDGKIDKEVISEILKNPENVQDVASANMMVQNAMLSNVVKLMQKEQTQNQGQER